MTPPAHRRRIVPLVVTVGVSVLLFACSAPDRPADQARFGPARSGEDPPPEPQAIPPETAEAPATPVSPAQGGPPAAQAAAPDTATAGAAGPVPPGSVSFGTPPQEAESVARPLTPRQRPLAGGSRVFSNKDLESYRSVKEEFGFRDNVVVMDLSGQQQGIGGGMSDEERERLATETRGRIEAISGEITYLKGRIPSLHNPFLPRAKVSDADAVDEAGMDNAERLARVQRRIAELNSEMGNLQKKLVDLTAPASTGTRN
jgi:hypothetical protein